MVCIETPEPHIRGIWGTQYVTLSFARPTPEESKVLAFTRYFCMGHLSSTFKIDPAWLDLNKREVPQEAGMEAALARLPLGTHRTPDDTPNPERF